MRRTAFLPVTALVLILVGSLVGFALGVTIDPPTPAASPPASLPEFGDPEPVVTPIPVVGDPWEDGLSVAEALAASRQAASEAGITLNSAQVLSQPALGGGASPVEAPSDEPKEVAGVLEVPEPVTGGITGPTGSEASERFVDECTTEEASESCPEGMHGVVLALRELAPLAGILTTSPLAPGTAPYPFNPECPPVAPSAGSASFGLSSNRPVDIVTTYYPRLVGGFDFSRPETFDWSTSPEQAGIWQAWFDDPSTDYSDPRYWIDHCFTITGLEPGSYGARAVITDQGDPSQVDEVAMVEFQVPDESGEVETLRQVRRPTVLRPSGIDRVYVSVTRPQAQDLVVQAVADSDLTATCDTGGDLAGVTGDDAPGRTTAVVVSDEAIPRDVMMAPTYPYLRDHNRSMLFRLDVAPGGDYVVCLYWLSVGGPSFRPESVVLSEQISISTPAAYSPVIRLEGFTNLFGLPDSVYVRVDHTACWHLTTAFEGAYTPTREVDSELCHPESNLSPIELGARVEMRLVDDDGVVYTSSAMVPLNLRCRSNPCPARSGEVALVPLPAIPTERRLCGSGFGGGCGGEIPMRSAGDVILSTEFLPLDDTASPGWAIGEAAEFEDTQPGLGETPLLSVESSVSWPSDPLSEGLGVDLVVTADRPVILQVTPNGYLGEAPCFVGSSPEPYVSATLALVHRIELRGLCSGQVYDVAITGADAGGVAAQMLRSRSLPLTNSFLLPLPQMSVTARATLELDLGEDEGPLIEVIPGAILIAPTEFPGGSLGMSTGASLGWGTGPAWFWSDSERSDMREAGWNPLDRGTICSYQPDPGPLTVNGDGGGLLLDVPLLVTASVDVNRGFPAGAEGVCRTGDDFTDYRFAATVTMADLVGPGVVMTSSDGRATLRLWITGVSPGR